jgi:hypothetical protein
MSQGLEPSRSNPHFDYIPASASRRERTGHAGAEGARLAAFLKNLAPIDAWTLSGTDGKSKIVRNGFFAGSDWNQMGFPRRNG